MKGAEEQVKSKPVSSFRRFIMTLLYLTAAVAVAVGGKIKTAAALGMAADAVRQVGG